MTTRAELAGINERRIHQSIARQGKYVVVNQRRAAGTLKIAVDAASSDSRTSA
jgi:hypothetical protein